MSKPDYVKAAEILIDKVYQLRERIKELELELENKKLRSIKCPPISDGDSCICPIEELETTIKNVCDLITKEGKVSKWKILNWLEKAPKG